MSAVFIIFAKKVGNERKIPFELTTDPFYSEKHMERLTRIIDGIEDGSNPLVIGKLLIMGKNSLERLFLLANSGQKTVK